MFIKICGLRHAGSIEAAIKAGADALGFVFTESIRQVTPRQAALLASRIPERVLRVAVMRKPDLELWREVELIFCPDVVQTDAADFSYLEVPADIKRWPVIRAGSADEAIMPDTFVYEGQASGQGEAVDWQVAAGLAKKGRMILAGGLTPENVAEAIATVAPFGVDVSSAVESSPGIKDPELIARFIAAARATEQGAAT
ncbi:MAG TPA: phosphoribosylanthranilate isomerase [Woeseiaceae bacterium]